MNPARFNEAAGIPRGRRLAREARREQAIVIRFNEAAGIPRGRRQARHLEVQRGPDASMRPRVFPAEDTPGTSLVDSRHASMRPRVFPAEDVGAGSESADHGALQ